MLEARQKWEAKTSAGRNRIQILELVMNAACSVVLAEIANDRPVSAHQLAVRSEIRMEVIDVAERIIRGEKLGSKVLRFGIPYTKDQAMIDFVEHTLSDDAIFAAWNGNRIHSLRALGIWLYTKAGYSDEYIMALAGHATEKMKAHYIEGHERTAPVRVNAGLSLASVDLSNIDWETVASRSMKAIID